MCPRSGESCKYHYTVSGWLVKTGIMSLSYGTGGFGTRSTRSMEKMSRSELEQMRALVFPGILEVRVT